MGMIRSMSSLALASLALFGSLSAEPLAQRSQTVTNGNIVYPPSSGFVDVLQRSEYLFQSQTKSYLQHSRALIFHAMSPYYAIQRNNTSCSLATATMILNTVRAILSHRHLDAPATQNEILEMVNDPLWDSATADEGPGVTLDQLGQLLQKMFHVYEIEGVSLEVVHVDDKSEKTRQTLHQDLMDLAHEKQETTLLALNFDDRCFISCKDNEGHISPVGAYDPHTGLALVFDVDREWTGPYWITEETLLNGLNTLDSSGQKYRGYVRIRLPSKLSECSIG